MKQFIVNKYAFTVLELLLVFCIIFILMGTFIAHANSTLQVAKGVALRNELGNIRMALEHYKIVNGEYPQELSDLIKEYLPDKATTNIISGQVYLKPIRVSENGELLDPYRNIYFYDSNSGRVWSSTKGFEGW